MKRVGGETMPMPLDLGPEPRTRRGEAAARLALPTDAPTVDLFVYGLPVAWARTGRRNFKGPGGVVQTTVYDPPKPREWKAVVKAQVVAAGRPPLLERETAVGLLLAFVFPRPASLPKRIVAHVRKPDLDNLVKAVKDALRGVVYLDDSQVKQQWATKAYGSPPGVQITVWRVA